MIFDTLENVFCYAGLGDGLLAALKYLLETDLASRPVGRTDVDGERIYVLALEYNTRTLEQGK